MFEICTSVCERVLYLSIFITVTYLCSEFLIYIYSQPPPFQSRKQVEESGKLQLNLQYHCLISLQLKRQKKKKKIRIFMNLNIIVFASL